MPQAALQIDQSGYYVLVVDGQTQGRAAPRPDRPEPRHRCRDHRGLKEGEKVIVDGIQKVRPGQVVQETDARPTAGGRAAEP